MGKLIDQARRARAREAKGDRKHQIRAAARDLFVQQPYVEITMDGICQRARLRKGLAAMYFGSKEELFLDLLKSQLGEWSDRLAAELVEAERLSRPELLEAVSASLDERPALTRMLGLLPVVLEQNVDLTAVLAFRERQRALVAAAAEAAGRACSEVDPSQGFELLRRALIVAGALDPLARPRGAAGLALVGGADHGTQVDLGAELRWMLAGFVSAAGS